MDFGLIFVAFIAGVLTILAPCIFPLLPILVGSSADGKANRNRAITVVSSLLITIAVLTLLIHGTSNFFNINEGVLRGISAVIIILVGLSSVFPHGWEYISSKLGFGTSSNKLLGRAMQKGGKSGDILIGVALGPVFSSCSPTYGLIIATILPVNFAEGAFYLFWYLLGLGLMFALIAVLGNKFTSKLTWATDPNGWLKRSVGVLFLVIGIAIMFNLDKSFEEWLLNFEFYNSLIGFELDLRK